MGLDQENPHAAWTERSPLGKAPASGRPPEGTIIIQAQSESPHPCQLEGHYQWQLLRIFAARTASHMTSYCKCPCKQHPQWNPLPPVFQKAAWWPQ